MRISDILTTPVREFPDKKAVKFLDTSLTFSQLYKNVCQAANALSRAGVKPGDAVCIICQNSIEFLETMFAVSFTGAVPALVNWRLSPSNVRDMVRQTGAKFAFISSSETTTIDYLREKEGDNLRLIIVPYRDKGEPNYAAFKAGMPESFDIYRTEDPNETGLIMFTSGTSGKAKGVMLSHRAVTAQALRCSKNGQWHKEDVFLCISPMFHSISLSVMALIFVGGELLVCPTDITRHVGNIFELVENEDVSTTALVPTMVNRLVSYMEANNLWSDKLKYIHYGASPMSRELLERCSKVFDCKFNQGYGMTETYGTVLNLYPEDHLNEKYLLSVGRPTPGTEVRVADENDESLPAGEIGEVCIKTISVMNGYLGLEEETARALRGGWYHTGDMGYLDENGYLFLTGRKNDMIITGGENVYPQEVERCILELKDDIDSVCVVGVDDEAWGEIIAALVVRMPGSTITEEKILEHCNKRLGRYKKPKKLLFVDAIPTTEMGKISRNRIKALFKED